MNGARRIGQVSALTFLGLTIWAQESETPLIDYAAQVQPILHTKCMACHNPQLRQGALALHTLEEMLRGGENGPAIVPGVSHESLLIQRVTGEKPPRMPFMSEPLTEEEIAILKTWIDQGARWSAANSARQTSSIAPRRPDLPAATSARFDHPVDAFVAEYLARNKKRFPLPVSDAVFVRRAYLDLWGLLPTPEQQERFLWDAQSNKREQLIDQLLAHRRNYAEHWISFWNDLLRNDEGVVYHGTRESISAWLLQALEKNLPYDRFVTELLNPIDEDDPKGFLMGVNWRGDVNASQRPPVQAAQNSAQVFLGINLKCASCHDSFVNRWKLRDSYGLAALFSDEPLRLVRCDVALEEMATPKFLFPELGPIPEGLGPKAHRVLAARLFTAPENGRFTRTLVNRIWKRLFGRGLVEPVDDMETAPWDQNLLDWLASDLVEHGYDLHFLLRRIMTSRAYQLPAVSRTPEEIAHYTFQGPLVRRLTAEQFVDAVSSITGEWRILSSNKAEPGVYSRDWRLKSSQLTRALGRPIRDQVFTERASQPTTLQALELVNGEELAYLLHRGARRLVGELEPAPASLYDSGLIRSGHAQVNVEISGVKKLWLLAEDVDSYDREQVVAGWAEAELVGPAETTPLADLEASAPVQLRATRAVERQLIEPATEQTPAVYETIYHEHPQTLVAPLPSILVYDIEGKGYTHFRASVAIDESSMRSDINPRVRFFVFAEEPDRRHLVGVTGQRPVAMKEEDFAPDELIRRLYRHALARDPVPGEYEAARTFLTAPGRPQKISSEGLEDLLWAIFLSPECQYIR